MLAILWLQTQHLFGKKPYIYFSVKKKKNTLHLFERKKERERERETQETAIKDTP